MSKRLWKKAITAVLTAALLMTTNNVASLNASAAEKTYIEGVYTNFQKATMATGTTKQIKAYVEPEDATIQRLQYRSSNSNVATVSTAGLITAVAPGTTTITVKALDGSSQEETIKVTVLKDLILMGKHVDQDNEIIVLDRTYGNLTIDSSVGDAVIYLAGITVRNNLTLESGEYSVTMYDSTANLVSFDGEKEDEIEIKSFATEEETVDGKTPKLIVGDNTKIAEIQARVNAAIRQEDGSQINGLRFSQNQEGKITIYLDGYNGELLLDASIGDLEIVLSNSTVANINVSGGEDVGHIRLINGGEATITNVTLTGAASLDLAVPTEEVTFDKKATGSALTISDTVGTLTNSGTDSKINIAGSVDNIVTEGSSASIDVKKDGFAGTIQMNGSATLYGAGEVVEAYVNADYCRIDTINTLVTIEDAEGTMVQGQVVKGGSSVTTTPPVVGGGGIGQEEPEKEYKAGDIILSNDFEDGKNGLLSTMGSLNMRILDGGKDSDKALMVYGKTANWNGVGIDFAPYIGKHITVRIKADIKAEEDGNLYATITHDGDYTSTGSMEGAKADTWYTLEGTFELGNDVKSAKLYFESPELSNYYLDNVSIIIDAIGDAIHVEGVSLDQSSLTMDTGASKTLTATVTPSNADNKEVIWSSADPSIATVNRGLVTGIKAGTTTITVKTIDGEFTAECEVTVTSNVALSINRKHVVLSDIGSAVTLTSSITNNISWSSSDTNVVTVDNGVVTAIADGTAIITATVDGSQNSASCTVTVNTKTILIEDFEDGKKDDLLVNDWATLTINNEDAYDGQYSLLVETSDEYNGVQYVFTNSSDSVKKYQVSAFVKNAQDGNVAVMLWEAGGSWSTYAENPMVGKDWVELNTGSDGKAIEVPAGSSVTARFKSTGASKFYIDNIVITELTQVDPSPTPEPIPGDDEIIYETSFEDGEPTLGADGGDITTEKSIVYDGSTSLKVVTAANWNGPQYTLTNNTESDNVYTISSYVRKDKEEDNSSVRYVMASDPYTTYGSIDLTTEWQLFETNITVEAGTSIKFRIAPIDALSNITYYVDNFKITKPVVQEPVYYFDDFYLAQSIDLTYTKYLDDVNFRQAAEAGEVEADVLAKFETWDGIKEVVHSYEFTIEMAPAQAITGGAITGSAITGSFIKAEIIIQNKGNDGWNDGTYLSETIDTGISLIVEPITLKYVIVLSDKTWKDTDTTAGKIEVKLNNVPEVTKPIAKVTIRVRSNQVK